jgi:hypothetical protein
MFAYDPKLEKICQFFRLFSLFSVLSIHRKNTFKAKDNEKIKFLIVYCRPVFGPPIDFLEILSLVTLC